VLLCGYNSIQLKKPIRHEKRCSVFFCERIFSGRVAGGKTPSRGKTPTQDIRGTGRNPVKCLLTISVGEWPEFVYIFGATR